MMTASLTQDYQEIANARMNTAELHCIGRLKQQRGKREKRGLELGKSERGSNDGDWLQGC